MLNPYWLLSKSATGSFISSALLHNWVGKIPEFVLRTNELCFDHYGRSPAQLEVKHSYLPLLQLCNWDQKPVSLFTTNYDPVTDYLLEMAEDQEIPSHDGFNRFGAWDSGGYSRVRSKGLAVYRLHGSLSWIEKDHRIINTRDYSKRVPGYAEHLLIYPGYKGNPESDGHQAFQFAHNSLKVALGESNILLVIGYSFRDPHLNAIIQEALRSNTKLSLVIWNPEWPEGSDVGLAEIHQVDEIRVRHHKQPFGQVSQDELLALSHEIRLS